MNVLKIKTTIDDIFKNPFDVDVVPHNLINIATGQVTSEIVQKDMTEFVERATKQRDSFITQRMVDQPKDKIFGTGKQSLVLRHLETCKNQQSELPIKQSLLTLRFYLEDCFLFPRTETLTCQLYLNLNCHQCHLPYFMMMAL